MTRAERVDRYREKKARRTDGGAVRYIARQQNAHRCVAKRVRTGRQLSATTAMSVCCLLHTAIGFPALESTLHVGSTLRCSPRRRPRIKGRFVKAEELAEYLASNPGVPS
jgi:hypothetical protein